MWFRGVAASVGLCLDLGAVFEGHPDVFLAVVRDVIDHRSGGDGQSLGIVLTPAHICELFCDLLDVKPDDIVLDKAVPRLIQRIPQIGAISGLFANGRPMRSYFFAPPPVR